MGAKVVRSHGDNAQAQLLRFAESFKLILALVGIAAYTGFVHSNTYSDTAFGVYGVLTACSSTLAFCSLCVATIFSLDVGAVSHADELDGYTKRFAYSVGIIVWNVALGGLSTSIG